ncbi:MAG TPA: hypothetical protein VF118_10730 [Gemmatimonadaceae bacterium]
MADADWRSEARVDRLSLERQHPQRTLVHAPQWLALGMDAGPDARCDTLVLLADRCAATSPTAASRACALRNRKSATAL